MIFRGSSPHDLHSEPSIRSQSAGRPVAVHLPEGVQPTIPMTIANTKVIVANQRMSPASVPRLDENIARLFLTIAATNAGETYGFLPAIRVLGLYLIKCAGPSARAHTFEQEAQELEIGSGPQRGSRASSL
jgi:hypothetical protein